MSTNQQRHSDPDFEPEPWASTLIDYCMFGGVAPPLPVNTEPLEPPRTYVPPAAPSKPRQPRQARKEPPPPAPPASKARKRRPSPPPPPPPFDVDGWRARLAEHQARLEAHLRALGGTAPSAPEPFRLLGAPYPCTTEELRARWRQLVFQYHPDRGGDLKQFIEMKAAYDDATRILEGGPFVVFRYSG